MSESPAGLFRGLFETHVQVKDLEKAMRFYGDVLGLEIGLRETERRVAFYWIGGKGRTVLGLWEKPPWLPAGNPVLPQCEHGVLEAGDLHQSVRSNPPHRYEDMEWRSDSG